MAIHEQKNIVLIAHDGKKKELIDWCNKNRTILQKHFLIGTDTTDKIYVPVLESVWVRV